METYDLIVVGGGPAGTSAAITAARVGAQVLLLERGRYPRHKVCGEFVSAESLGLLQDLLDSAHSSVLVDARRIPRARIFIDDRILETPIDPPAASIARLDLDSALWQAAEKSGIDAKQQTTVDSISGSGPFMVTTLAGTFEARSVINASGRWSNLRVPRNGEPPGVHWLGLKAHFAERSCSDSVDLYFFEGGYCGVQPVTLANEMPGRVNACAMVRADVASKLHDVFRHDPQLCERSRHWQSLTEPVSTSPLIFREPQPECDGVLLAGDAAGFVDPFVGDGISLALRGGALAVECLTPFFAGKISLMEARTRYCDRYERTLAPVFRTCSKIRRMLLLPRVVRVGMLSMLGASPALASYVVRKARLG